MLSARMSRCSRELAAAKAEIERLREYERVSREADALLLQGLLHQVVVQIKRLQEDAEMWEQRAMRWLTTYATPAEREAALAALADHDKRMKGDEPFGPGYGSSI